MKFADPKSEFAFKKIFALCIPLLFCASLWAMGETPPPAVRPALLMMDIETSPNEFIVDDTLHAQLWPLCEKYNIEILYLEIPVSLAINPGALSKFIANAHSHGLAVFSIFGSPEWAYKHFHGLQATDQFLSYNDGHGATQKLDGILVNVNFESLPESPQNGPALLDKYFQLLKKIHVQIAAAGESTPCLVVLSDPLMGAYQQSEAGKLGQGILSRSHPQLFLDIKEDKLSVKTRNLM